MTKTSRTSARYDEVSFQRIERVIGSQQERALPAGGCERPWGGPGGGAELGGLSQARILMRLAGPRRPRRELIALVLPGTRVRLKFVAHTTDGHDVSGRGRIIFDLLPQPADVHVHRARAAVVVVSPDVL